MRESQRHVQVICNCFGLSHLCRIYTKTIQRLVLSVGKETFSNKPIDEVFTRCNQQRTIQKSTRQNVVPEAQLSNPRVANNVGMSM